MRAQQVVKEYVCLCAGHLDLGRRAPGSPAPLVVDAPLRAVLDRGSGGSKKAFGGREETTSRAHLDPWA